MTLKRTMLATAAAAVMGTQALPALAQDFEVGEEGFSANTNNWPGGEAPEFAIDGVGQKYLNFGKEDTGVAVTPSGGAAVAVAITLWTANDEGQRDPASFAIYGTNDPITAMNPGDVISGLTLVATDAIALPASRNAGGAAPLLAANSATVGFANATAYTTYIVVFPTLKSSASANSMQVAEIQLMDGAAAPLFAPGDGLLGGQLVAPTPGACCFGDATCQELVRVQCEDAGGQFQDGQACTDVKCLGACCLPNGVCADSFVEDECVAAGGTFGLFTTCEETDCAGACCINQFDCFEGLTPAECADMGGIYQGNATICLGVSCTNDSCQNRILITDGATPFSTRLASADPNDPLIECLSDSPGPDIWFNYIASCDGVLRIDASDADFGALVEAFESFACPPNPTDRLGCAGEQVSDGGAAEAVLNIAVVAGQEIKIRIGGWGSQTGSGFLTLTCGDQASNDECDDRAVVLDGSTAFDTRYATLNASDPPFGCDAVVGPDVWFNYTATCDGAVRIDTCGTEFETVLEVYRSTTCPPDSVDRLACSSQNSELDCIGGGRAGVVLPVSSGDELKIRVAGWPGASGLGLLNIECADAPPNDECADRLVVADGLTPFDTTFATVNAADPEPPCVGFRDIGGDVWFNYAATCDGMAVIRAHAGFQPVIEVFDGASCPVTPETRLVCVTDEAAVVGVTGGQILKIRVGGWGAGDRGPGFLDVSCQPPLANDDCSGRLDITEGLTPFDTAGATRSPFDPPFCQVTDSGDIWFNYTASADGEATIRVLADGDVIHAVYDGDACPPQATLSCNVNANPSVHVVSAGQTLKIRLAGWRSEGPLSGVVDITCDPNQACCLPGPDCVDTTVDDCASQGGLLQGPGILCTDVDCAAPVAGACCAADGTCDDTLTPEACLDAGGVYQGASTTCDAILCAGACCLPLGACIEGTSDECLAMGGDFRGSSTVCGESCVVDNDACETRQIITDGTTLFDVRLATLDEDDPSVPCLSSPSGPDVWFNYTASCDGIAVFDATGIGFLAFAAVYDGSACPPTTLLGCGRGETVGVPVTAGQLLKVRVGSWNGPPGAGLLEIACSEPVANDECDDRITITDGLTVFDTTFALLDPAAPIVECDDDPGGDVWFNYVASCDGLAQIDACSDERVVIEVYDGLACPPAIESRLGCVTANSGSAKCEPGQDQGTSVTIPVTTGQAIKIRVVGWQGNRASGVLSVSCGPPMVSGDLCADRVVVTEGTTAFDTTDATVLVTDPEAPCLTGTRIGGDLWFNWTAPCDGLALIDTCGSSFPTLLEVYDTTACPPDEGLRLACSNGRDDDVPCPGDIAGVEVPVAANQELKIRVGGWNGESGPGLLNIACLPAEACCFEGDTCEELVASACLAQGGLAQGAGTSCAEIDCADPPVGACCQTDGMCVDNVGAEACSTLGGVYQGADSTCASDTCAGACCVPNGTCHDDLNATECQALSGLYQGAGSTCVTTLCNDDCDNRILIADGLTPFDTTNATIDGDLAPCANANTADVWFNYVASCDGVVRLHVQSNYRHLLEVFDALACPPNDADRLGCTDDSTLVVDVTADQAVKIRVSGWNGGVGTGVLSLSCHAAAENDDCAARAVAEDGVTPYDLTYASLDLDDPPLACPDQNAGGDVWFNYTATCDGVAVIARVGGDRGPIEVYASLDCPPDPADLIQCERELLVVPVTSGQDLKIRLFADENDGGTPGLLSIACVALDFDSNDLCGNRIEIVDGTTYFDTTFGELDPAAPPFACEFDPGPDVWFNYVATASGQLSVDTCGSAVPMILELFDTHDCGDLDANRLVCATPGSHAASCGGAGNTQSSVTVDVTTGDELKIRVASWNDDDAAPGQLNVTCDPIGACCFGDTDTCDDIFESVCLLLGGTPQGPATFCGPPAAPFGLPVDCLDPPTGACCEADGSCTDDVTAAVCASTGGQFQAAGATCADANVLCTGACCLPDDICFDNGPSECSEAGGVYLGVGTECSGGNACPTLFLVNDDCESRLLLGDEPVLYTTTGATLDLDAPPFSCEFRDVDIWFNYEATTDGVAEVQSVSLAGSGGLEVFDTWGCPPDPSTRLVCAPARSLTTTAHVPVVAGQRIKIRVGTWANQTGPGFISVTCTSNQACCLADGTCLEVLPPKCLAQGGVPQGEGSVCLGDSNANDIDDICDVAPCCLTTGCQPLPGGSCLDLGGTVLTWDCPADLTIECIGPGVPTPPDVASSGDATLLQGTCDVAVMRLEDEVIPNADPCNPYTIIRRWTNTCVPDFVCTQIFEYVDTTGPALDGDPPPNRTSACHSIPIAAETLAAADACDASVSEFTLEPDVITPGDCTQEFLITRTWTAADTCGNSSTITQLITVVDNDAPTIDAPKNLSLECVSDVPDPEDVKVLDLCAPSKDIDVDVVDSTNKGSGCADDPLVITRMYVATDPCGNVAMSTQTITVEDNEAPVLSGVPASITIDCTDPIPTPAKMTATDNCTAKPTITFDETTVPGACADSFLIQRVWQAADACRNTSSVRVHTITVVDSTPPTVKGCPRDISVHAAAGTCEAVVSWPEPMLDDDCDPAPTATYDVDLDNDGGVDLIGLSAPTVTLPPGTHRVTLVAADRCGNTNTSCSFLITVSDQNEVLVDVELSPTVVTPLTRCITFEFSGTSGNVTIEQLVDFTDGLAEGVPILIPCGEYDCVGVRDPLHTLRSTVPLLIGVNGSSYTADVTGAAHLVGGNLNDDTFIDILDFGIFSGQFGLELPAPGCATKGPHADINGSGTVDTPDFTFIQINIFGASDDPCVESLSTATSMPDVAGPVLSIEVEALWRHGLGHLTPADLNEDGILDARDASMFVKGVRPSRRVGVLRQDVERASWFDRDAWAGGFVPDAITEVHVDRGELRLEGAATAAMVDIDRGATLTLADDASLTAESVVIRAGGTLDLRGAETVLSVTTLYVEAGATLLWNEGLIHIDDGGMLVDEDGGIHLQHGRLELGRGARVFARPPLEFGASEQP